MLDKKLRELGIADEDIPKIKQAFKSELPERKNLDGNFLNDPYCNSCRQAERFCKCDGYNAYRDKVEEML